MHESRRPRASPQPNPADCCLTRPPHVDPKETVAVLGSGYSNKPKRKCDAATDSRSAQERVWFPSTETIDLPASRSLCATAKQVLICLATYTSALVAQHKVQPHGADQYWTKINTEPCIERRPATHSNTAKPLVVAAGAANACSGHRAQQFQRSRRRPSKLPGLAGAHESCLRHTAFLKAS